MVGDKEHFVISEALTCLFLHFLLHSLHVVAQDCKNVGLKRRKKIKKVAFHPNQKRGGCTLCRFLLDPAALHISFSCKLNPAVMSTLSCLSSRCFCLQKFFAQLTYTCGKQLFSNISSSYFMITHNRNQVLVYVISWRSFHYEIKWN